MTGGPSWCIMQYICMQSKSYRSGPVCGHVDDGPDKEETGHRHSVADVAVVAAARVLPLRETENTRSAKNTPVLPLKETENTRPAG